MKRFFEQLKTLLWLRSRLMIHTVSRHGKFNLVMTAIILCVAVGGSVSAFGAAMTLGSLFIDRLTPDQVMLAQDVMIAFFLFVFGVGVLTELQQTEAISLENLLHLPMSFTSAFMLNYARSLGSLTLLLAIPPTIGLTVALIFAHGPRLLITVPLLVSFLFMVTAITHLFRGWLAGVMANKRRRRTVVLFFAVTIMACSQLPMVVSMSFARVSRDGDQEYNQSLQRLHNDLQEQRITGHEYHEELTKLNAKRRSLRKKRESAAMEQVTTIATTANQWVPLGWIAYGTKSALEGNILPGVLGSIGATILGAICLWRSYTRTMRIYRGEVQLQGSRKKPKKSDASSSSKLRDRWKSMLQWDLPLLSPTASAITTASFRSLLRGSESKMMLVSGGVLIPLIGSMMFGVGEEIPSLAFRAMAPGATVFSMFSMAPIVQNIFAFDRDGFRLFVLSPVPGREILVGKNLALAPIVIVFGVAISAFVIAYSGQNYLDIVSNVLLISSAYLGLCIFGNWMSILIPFAVKPGAVNAANQSLTNAVVQFLAMAVLPVLVIPLGAPLAAEIILKEMDIVNGVPIYFLAMLVEFPIILLLYLLCVRHQGQLLERRQQRILDVVSEKVE